MYSDQVIDKHYTDKLTMTLIFIDSELGSYYMHGGAFGTHTIHNTGNSAQDTTRLIAHWRGYIQNNGGELA
jgi:hypothetical protein